MTYVLVLMAGQGSQLDRGDVAHIHSGLMAESAVAAPRWLSPGEACEVAFAAATEADARRLRDAAAAVFAGATVDVCVAPGEGRRKRLLVADMDSTIIQQECIDEMADVLGLKDKIAAITERAMRGELVFEEALRERLRLLEGITEDQLESVYTQRITLMPGARILVATMRAHGAFTALVSGGFTFFTGRVAARVGFDTNRANHLVVENGRMTGKVVEPILGKAAKLAALQEFAGAKGLTRDATLAVGDGANDLAMVKAAGLGVAYHAKPVVAAEAAAAIDHCDLTALLYLQGYHRDEFKD